MLNIRIILKTLGFLLFVEGFFMLIALIVSILYKGPDIRSFLYSALLSMGIGTVAVIPSRNAKKEMGKREGFVIVSLVWIIFSFFGSLPYLFSGSIPSLTDAFFETMSGFTTTGASVLNSIEPLPHGILFWRSMTQWLGGMGIIVLSLTVLPLFGIGGMQLFAAEVPGPTPDKLNPKISQTAKNLWGIYVLFTILETILLWMGGMSFFDAINHSFTTMATGGYSTKQASIAYWDSAYIQYVIIFFMFLSGTNFTLSYCAFTGKFRKIIHDEEFKYYVLFIVGFTLLIFSGLLISTRLDAEKAFRDALFQVVSVITTTGFATVDFLQWQPILIILLFALFFFGGSAGSTGGGIKIMRIVLLIKNSYYELRRMIHPNAVIPVRFNRHAVSDQIITNVLAFFMFYVAVFFLSTIIFTVVEPNMESSMGAVATCLGNIGPGLGQMGPAGNFAHVEPFGKWFLSFLMLLGRLELFTILVLFSPSFWKK
ncbi:MAG: TrkH family potassium uptake protein [Prolixibacteraceae bacterium]|jgi:trk system potassium uptake protein TrkH|nr:TrkH family potassium uptake protein [Prolixibacteraceae bacterium]